MHYTTLHYTILHYTALLCNVACPVLTLASASTLFASLSLLALLSKEAYTTNAITLSSSVNRRELECTDPLLLLEGKGSFDPFFPLGSVLGVMVKCRWKRQDEERG